MKNKCLMDLKEYLTTLSKENLISLLMDLADINKEVRSYLTEKQNALPVLSEQNKPILPVADTLFNSTSAINRHSTPQQKIGLFKSLFSGRQDVFALRWFNPKSNKSGYSPVCRNK
ncbi:MAG: type III restriction endonuclease subunit R, partial [Treponema sp.]|nr:type III restriction endonuclease subunit R [Treponema sp.]